MLQHNLKKSNENGENRPDIASLGVVIIFTVNICAAAEVMHHTTLSLCNQATNEKRVAPLLTIITLIVQPHLAILKKYYKPLHSIYKREKHVTGSTVLLTQMKDRNCLLEVALKLPCFHRSQLGERF
uniref:Uncharacterized protein n=1 Tax=Glossina austeni TaxID=7395 RepID=A0A1A9V7U3_GLOAU